MKLSPFSTARDSAILAKRHVVCALVFGVESSCSLWTVFSGMDHSQLRSYLLANSGEKEQLELVWWACDDMNDDLPQGFLEALKLGCVSSSSWQSYTWKNELVEQQRRVLQHIDEALGDIDTDHNPLHMLERAIGVLPSACVGSSNAAL